MLPEKRARVAKTFFVISVGTFLILIYLFLFNQGFHVTDALLSEAGLTVSVQNNSVHLIRDIKVFYRDATGQQVIIKEIDLLKPDEEQTVLLREAYAVGNKIQLTAEAPYHPRIVKEIFLKGLGEVAPEVRLLPSISVPRTVLVGTPALVTVNICNEGSTLNNIELKVNVDSEYFDLDKTSEVFNLASGDCIVKDFFVTGKKAGSSTIYFNIIALSLSEEYSATIKIAE